MTEITETVARKVLTTIDAGLVRGVGKPKPGQMCVMAAINYALGHEHGDKPSCVHPVVRDFDIRLNDSNWSSDKARAKGMRREAIAKLGSTGIDGMQFARLVAFGSMTRILPKVLRFAASKGKGGEHDAALEAAAVELENAKDHAAAVEATSKASRATAKARANAYANADADADANANANANANPDPDPDTHLLARHRRSVAGRGEQRDDELRVHRHAEREPERHGVR